MSNADRDTLLALAERVEGLSNPDREVDALIACSLIKDIAKLAVLNTPEKWAKAAIQENWNIQRYTASLDAAKTLVPKGWHVGMLTECDEDDSPSCCLTQGEEPCRNAVGRGADMAFSLVAASLRARAGGL